MTRSVSDAALLLAALAGVDVADPATQEGAGRSADYSAALRKDGLQGKRIGVARNFFGRSGAVDAIIEQELAVLKAQGASWSTSRCRTPTSTATANWKCCCTSSSLAWRHILKLTPLTRRFAPWPA